MDVISFSIAKKKVNWNEVKNKLASEGAINVLYDTDKDNLVDQIRTITRADLEYPTENVNYIYLSIIGKTIRSSFLGAEYHWAYLTSDNFTDKAIEILLLKDVYDYNIGRFVDGNNFYINHIDTGAVTADFACWILSGGTFTKLGYEAVDLPSYNYFVKLSISGSTLSNYRSPDMSILRFSVTDTTFSSGKYGGGSRGSGVTLMILNWYITPPSSPLPQPLRIFETDVIGSGGENDPYRPNLLQDLREISQLTGLPEFLYQEAKKYEILKNKGFTDEEIELLFGSIPQHQVDLNAVTYGSFEFRHDSPTNIIAIYQDNPYQSGAILKQEETVKAKNLRVLKPPRDYLEAKQQYNELRKEFTHWLAGLHNYCYQMIGHEDFEAMQASDFYYGELIEHKTHYKQIKQVSDWEIRRNLNRWKERLKRGTILAEEREKHLRKFEEIERLGW